MFICSKGRPVKPSVGSGCEEWAVGQSRLCPTCKQHDLIIFSFIACSIFHPIIGNKSVKKQSVSTLLYLSPIILLVHQRRDAGDKSKSEIAIKRAESSESSSSKASPPKYHNNDEISAQKRSEAKGSPKEESQAVESAVSKEVVTEEKGKKKKKKKKSSGNEDEAVEGVAHYDEYKVGR